MDNLLPENFGKVLGDAVSPIDRKTLPPTWRGVLPLIISSIIEGSDNSRKIAIEELYRLADFADTRREG